MPIRRYLGEGVFLGFSRFSNEQSVGGDDRNPWGRGYEIKRQAVARVIIRLAREDASLDSAALRDRAVSAFGGVAYCDVHASPQPLPDLRA
jgi:hypothetical protein